MAKLRLVAMHSLMYLDYRPVVPAQFMEGYVLGGFALAIHSSWKPEQKAT